MCCRWWYGGFGGFEMLLGTLLGLALLAGLVILIIWLVRRPGTAELRHPHFNTTSSAIETVKERYAKGEISREEYQNLISDLERR